MQSTLLEVLTVWVNNLKLYTNKKYISNKDNFIEYVDVYFDSFATYHKIDGKYADELRVLDRSKLSDCYGNIVTPFGTTGFENISTGCKTTMLCRAYQNSDKIISLEECGSNAIEYIFEHFDNISIYMTSESGFYSFGKEIIVNDKHAFNTADIASNWR